MDDQEDTKEEAERRAQAVARRMLNTPLQPKKKPPEAAAGSPGYKLGRQQPGPPQQELPPTRELERPKK